MSTIASQIIEEILEEENLGRTADQARRILEHNKSQKRLEIQFRDWEEAA